MHIRAIEHWEAGIGPLECEEQVGAAEQHDLGALLGREDARIGRASSAPLGATTVADEMAPYSRVSITIRVPMMPTDLNLPRFTAASTSGIPFRIGKGDIGRSSPMQK